MKRIKIILFAVLLFSLVVESMAQSKITAYKFKKGEVLDILVLSSKPDIGQLFDRYKKTAFPVAFRMSYQSLPGFKITDNLEGNHHPNSFILGKWSTVEKREKFLVEINKEVPDFHEQRRDIFSYFGLTYYEIPHNLNFQIDRNKYNVVTAYWYEGSNSSEYSKEWIQRVKDAGGNIIIQLTKGKSPYGYYYNPDYLTIVEWETKEAFGNFKEEDSKISHHGLRHINQFAIK